MKKYLCPCQSGNLKEVIAFNKKPEGETEFLIPEKNYSRKYLKCNICGHFVSELEFDISLIYSKDYVTSTYGSISGMKKKYDFIMNLPEKFSDNRSRVKRINNQISQAGESKEMNLLDFGAGLGVFPALMREYGWLPYAIEPDERTIKHLKDVGINNVYSSIEDMTSKYHGKFDLISLNKVLEHMDKPNEVILKLLPFLSISGLFYIEVPDAESVYKYDDPLKREEFFIEHVHGFTPTSLSLLMSNAGLSIIKMESIREPSDKYTLLAFGKV